MDPKQWRTAGRLGSAVAAAALVAACANPRPAPVVNRTNLPPLPAPEVVQPVPPPVATQPGQMQPGQGTGQAGGVEVSPIRSGGIESGNLTPGAAAADPNLKTGPRGIKRPYEEVAAVVPTNAPPSIAAMPAPPPAPPKAPEPPPAATGTGLLDGVAFGWPASGTVLENFDETSSKGLSLGGKAGDVVRRAPRLRQPHHREAPERVAVGVCA